MSQDSQPQSLHQTIHFGNGPKKRTDKGTLSDTWPNSRQLFPSVVLGRNRYPTQFIRRRTSQGSHFPDSSDRLFAMYLRIAEEEDQMRAELLKADTDQILIFVSPRIT